LTLHCAMHHSSAAMPTHRPDGDIDAARLILPLTFILLINI